MKHKEVVLICFLIVSIVSNMTLLGMYFYNIQNDNQRDTIIEQEKESTVIQTKELDYEQYLRGIFTEDELCQIGKKAWDIVISVNGQQFKSNTIYTQSNNLNILIGQVRNHMNIADSIAQMGSLEGEEHKLIDYVHVYTENPYTVEVKEDAEGYKYYLKFDDIQDNTIISIELSQQLKERLQYADKITDNLLSIVKR